MQYYTNNPYPREEPYNTTAWKLKRKRILSRDNLECQECFNNYIVEKSRIGEILKVDDYISLLSSLNMSDERFYKFGYKIVYLDDLGKEYSQNILSHIRVNYFEQFIGCKLLLCNIRSKSKEKAFLFDSLNQKSTDTIINGIKNPNSDDLENRWFYVRNLHVHHISYPDDDDIANVPDEELITLCANCHQKKHPTKKLTGYCD